MTGVNRSSRKYQQKRVEANQKSPQTISGHTRRSQTPKRQSHQPVSIDETNDSSQILFVRSGIQNKVQKRLKRGELLPRSGRQELDLHGVRAHQAGEMLEHFIEESLEFGHSCVLIIHGKGFRSVDAKGVIKPLTIDWLKHAPDVLAFCSAQPRDGGSGAEYVLLKRSRSEIP